MQINEIIKGLREDKDLTQSELGKIFNVNQITISQYERGTRQLNPDMIIKYAKFFKVSTDYILGLTRIPTPPWSTNQKAKNIANISENNNGTINMN